MKALQVASAPTAASFFNGRGARSGGGAAHDCDMPQDKELRLRAGGIMVVFVEDGACGGGGTLGVGGSAAEGCTTGTLG